MASTSKTAILIGSPASKRPGAITAPIAITFATQRAITIGILKAKRWATRWFTRRANGLPIAGLLGACLEFVCIRIAPVGSRYFSGEKPVGLRNQLLTPLPAVSEPPAPFSESVRTWFQTGSSRKVPKEAFWASGEAWVRK